MKPAAPFAGQILRQEVYVLDETDESDRPYSVSERNYTIKILQPQGPNQFSAFFAHPRETIDFHYERTLYKVVGNTLADQNAPPANAITAADPRVTHAITLSVDPFGNVLQSVAVGYGRRYLDPALSAADQSRQNIVLSTYAENVYTNAVFLDDSYRTPLPAQVATYELIQFQPESNQVGLTNLFRFDELQSKVKNASDGAHEIPFENLMSIWPECRPALSATPRANEDVLSPRRYGWSNRRSQGFAFSWQIRTFGAARIELQNGFYAWLGFAGLPAQWSSPPANSGNHSWEHRF